jgi:agmatine deiminase
LEETHLEEETRDHRLYRMPAEWEAQEGTWLQWPHDKLYRGYQLKLEGMWLAMVDALHRRENVHIIVADAQQRDHIAHQLEYFDIGLQNVHMYLISTNDVWVRDNGPTFVVDGQGSVAITDWEFNGWGNRFPYDLDNQVPSSIGERLSIPVFKPPMVLEGGAVEVNGRGTMMATRTSIIDPYRNPGMSQEAIETVLREYLGVRHFIWLTGAGRGECEEWGDDTDSHIDIVARFTDESTVLYNWTDDRSDPRYAMVTMTLAELQEATTESGKPLTLVALPLPQVHRVSTMTEWRPSTWTDAAYSNYLVANGIVLVPVFGHANDERAKGILREQFSDREIIGIDAVGLIEHGGAIACVTQPQPMGSGPSLPLTRGSS